MRGDVSEMGIANLGEAIPQPHRIDRFGQLGAARLIDTARIDPDVPVASLAGDSARLSDLPRELRVAPDGIIRLPEMIAGVLGQAWRRCA